MSPLEGHSIKAGTSEWQRLDRLVSESFPKRKANRAIDPTYYVWKVKNDFLVFAATNAGQDQPDCTAQLFWFDRSLRPLDTQDFIAGGESTFRHFTSYSQCLLVPLPGTADYVIEIGLNSGKVDSVREVFGLEGRRLVLIRYAKPPLSNQTSAIPGNSQRTMPRETLAAYDYRSSRRLDGPYAYPHTKDNLLSDLRNTKPVAQLKALTWLTGIHDARSPLADGLQFSTAHKAPEVVEAVRSLESSPVPWVSEMAKRFDAH